MNVTGTAHAWDLARVEAVLEIHLRIDFIVSSIASQSQIQNLGGMR